MNDDLRRRLLGSDFRDGGCDAGFEVLDQYAEAVLRGDDVARLSAFLLSGSVRLGDVAESLVHFLPPDSCAVPAS